MIRPGQADDDFLTEQELISGKSHYYADSGAADAYVITADPAIAAYAAGQRFSFNASAANTGASTLNVNARGAKAIKKLHDQALAAGDIEAGQIVEVEYDGTNFQMMSQLATASASSSAGGTYEVLTSSGNWTVPAGIYTVWVSATAGGGGGAGGAGGGGASTTVAGCGGGGASGGSAGDACINFPMACVPAQVIAYVVGAAGTLGTGSAGSVGTGSALIGNAAADGGQTTFGNVTLFGGLKGNPGAAHAYNAAGGAGAAAAAPADPKIEGAVVSTASLDAYLFWDSVAPCIGFAGGAAAAQGAAVSWAAATTSMGLGHNRGTQGGRSAAGTGVTPGGGGGTGGNGGASAFCDITTTSPIGGNGGNEHTNGNNGTDATSCGATQYGCGGDGGSGGGGAGHAASGTTTGGDGGDGANGGIGTIILRY